MGIEYTTKSDHPPRCGCTVAVPVTPLTRSHPLTGSRRFPRSRCAAAGGALAVSAGLLDFHERHCILIRNQGFSTQSELHGPDTEKRKKCLGWFGVFEEVCTGDSTLFQRYIYVSVLQLVRWPEAPQDRDNATWIAKFACRVSHTPLQTRETPRETPSAPRSYPPGPLAAPLPGSLPPGPLPLGLAPPGLTCCPFPQRAISSKCNCTYAPFLANVTVFYIICSKCNCTYASFRASVTVSMHHLAAPALRGTDRGRRRPIAEPGVCMGPVGLPQRRHGGSQNTPLPDLPPAPSVSATWLTHTK